MIKQSTSDFYTQTLDINIISKTRVSFFIEKIKNRSTLHYGCADWPVYNTSTNLHLSLIPHISNIDGYDPNTETITLMKKSNMYSNTTLYDSIPDKQYDFILVPETIEHVNNVVKLLSDISTNAHSDTDILITAPNALCTEHLTRHTLKNNVWTEIVHPDHNYWFSPYTLYNSIYKGYKELGFNTTFSEVGVIANNTMVYCIFKISKL